MRRALLLPVLAILAAACEPDLGAPASLVTGPRVLAIRSDPAEVPPGTDVALTALVVDPDGTASPDLGWGLCDEPPPLSDNNVVGDDCVRAPSPLDPRGVEVTLRVPVAACSVFGPTPPAPEPGQPPRRPHDPDVTGGFYQPFVAEAELGGEALSAVGLTRITCDLANAPIDIVTDFRARYHANLNPTLERVVAQLPGQTDAVTLPAALPAATDVPLRARWSEGSAETFPVFDPESRTLVDQREAIRVSWFVSGGELASERTGRTPDDTGSYAEDVWTTPSAGPAHLWVVVRDSRGGMDLAAFDVDIIR